MCMFQFNCNHPLYDAVLKFYDAVLKYNNKISERVVHTVDQCEQPFFYKNFQEINELNI